MGAAPIPSGELRPRKLSPVECNRAGLDLSCIDESMHVTLYYRKALYLMAKTMVSG